MGATHGEGAKGDRVEAERVEAERVERAAAKRAAAKRAAAKRAAAKRELTRAQRRRLERLERRRALMAKRLEEKKRRNAPPSPTCASVNFASPCWLRAKDAACHAWNPHPKLGESISYGGGCRGGKADGIGMLTWSSGTQEMGTFVAGKFSGGTRWDKKSVFEQGRFADGKFDGLVGWPHGKTFRGTVHWPKSKGQPVVATGVATEPNGEVWRGTFHSWKPHGHMRVTTADGIEFDGMWDRDKGNQAGQLTYHFMGDALRTVIDVVDGKLAKKIVYRLKRGNVWTDVTKKTWDVKFSKTSGAPVEAWSWKSGGTSTIAFRLAGYDARALYSALALTEKNETNPDPTRTIVSAEERHNPFTVMAARMWPTWSVKRASSTAAAGDSRYRLACYRWSRKNPPPRGAHDLCRIEISLGKTYKRARIYYQGRTRVLDVEDLPDSRAASLLYDAMKGPETIRAHRKNKARRRKVQSPNLSWVLHCYEYLSADGKTPRYRAGKPWRTCRFNFVAPKGKQQVTAGGWAGPKQR